MGSLGVIVLTTLLGAGDGDIVRRAVFATASLTWDQAMVQAGRLDRDNSIRSTSEFEKNCKDARRRKENTGQPTET